MQLPPREVLASWPKGDFDHPAHVRGPAILVMVAVFAPLMISVVAARTYSRIHIVKEFGADDMFILAALPNALGLAMVGIYTTENIGWKKHVWDMATRQDLLTKGLRFIVLTEIL